MARRLPPLNALRAFEAAARHLSFTRAAEELNVTPAAISHQIKALEAFLGMPLFQRRNREVLLTELGQLYYPGLRDGFDAIQLATERLTSADGTGELRITVLSSFGAKWLMPRLRRFRAQNPEIDVLMSSSDELIDLNVDNFDVAIRFGNGIYPDMMVIPLFGDDVFPVCSPELPTPDHPLDKPKDLSAHVLLHDQFDVNWETWLRAAGVSGVNFARGPRFDDSALVLQAAIDGQGVALARSSLAGADLAQGRLIRLFGISLPSRWKYYLVHLPSSGERQKVRLFKDWILREAATYAGVDPKVPPTEPAALASNGSGA